MYKQFKPRDWVLRTGEDFGKVRQGSHYCVREVGVYGSLSLMDVNGTYMGAGFKPDQFAAVRCTTAPAPEPKSDPLQTWVKEKLGADITAAVSMKATNPKEAIGSAKLDLSVVPDTMQAYAATAFTEGALKYGSYNWRVAGVRASTYIAACRRHMAKWWNGERCDPRTKVHHLASSMACLAIVLDAEVVGKLNDDRPPKADMDALIVSLEGTVAHLKELSAGIQVTHHTELGAANAN